MKLHELYVFIIIIAAVEFLCNLAVLYVSYKKLD